MEEFLRNWRQDALNKGQYDSAVYIGDKVLALTTLLSTKDLITRNSSCRYLAAHCYIKQNKFDLALSILGEHNPTHLIQSASRRKKPHLNGGSHVTLRNGRSIPSRTDKSDTDAYQDANHIKYEAAMCYLRGCCYANQNAFDRARDCYKDAVRIDVQCFEAFDRLMRNSLMSPTEELEFLESLDFDSITPSSDVSLSQEASEFTKLLYTTRLSKYSSCSALSHAIETLSTHYNLADNSDLLLSRAETLYTQCRFPEALSLTSSILSASDSMSALVSQGSQSQNLGHSPSVYPLHLACLYETGATNALFLLAHTLSDNVPEEPYTYLAIGVYYLSVSKIAEARRFFSKSSLLDPHSAPAWIGFAHTFAAEGEHDQAIAAYSTAARLFQGSHLPQLFLGMQHLALNNMALAHEYLSAAYSMSSGSPSTSNTLSLSVNSAGEPPVPGPSGGDPLVLNELGVVLYHEANLEDAVHLFRQALALSVSLECDPSAWLATRANLGHALRRLGKLEEALSEFDECLRIGAGGSTTIYTGYTGRAGAGAVRSAGASAVGGYEDRGLIGSFHTARGIILLEMDRTTDAVTALHEAVRVLGTTGGDAAAGAGVAGTLLSKALEVWAVEEETRVVSFQDTSKARKGKYSSANSNNEKLRHRSTAKGTKKSATVDEWTDDVPDRPSSSGPDVQNIGMELDGEANDLLEHALEILGLALLTKRGLVLIYQNQVVSGRQGQLEDEVLREALVDDRLCQPLSDHGLIPLELYQKRIFMNC
ncbi:uncharacterized protein ARB_06948 [Trichophyton benhamiae CBS 112371]|uniref:Uncharacterized protein n=1 Tax=Arthroderma benhamiae (strain ATCC MYA-4681 / CBS 112371) TaxID=663331 RepID=D4ART4_ARTBC|nr:uncharacterized protein ARB_06948 [Trichophyton benhamiae CBS 112371]EFE33998.1 hypothetical protein ARB_06948 [Trichophyton benhamiae CBS 112371]